MSYSILKIIILLSLGIISKLTIAQGVEVVHQVKLKFPPYPDNKASVFIHQRTDTSKLEFVATYRTIGIDSLTTPGDLFLLIKKKARKDGANCFALRSFWYDSIKRPNLVIDAYYGSDTTLKAIAAYYETNVVYLFGSERTSRDSISLKINDSVHKFATGTYLKFVLREGESLKMSKGGFTGVRVRLKFEKEKPAMYLMVHVGTRLGKGPLPPPGTIGISFNTGEIREMTDDYGQFLAQILKKSD